MSQSPIPLETVKRETLAHIKGVCFDIDDTFSSEGKITAEAFQALWDLKNAGFALIPVTGRPAGWCDHIARFWPVDAVVGENGAFTFFMHEKKLERFETLPMADAKAARAKLSDLKQKIVKEFPIAKFASDQDYREYDLAIDFCEDVAPWSEAEIDRLEKFCQDAGAIAKISSIHVNTWFGRYTKIEGIRAFLKHADETLKLGLPKFDEFIYAGDSPNDEPMFQAFPLSVGVANVRPYLPRLKSPPTYITSKNAGEGFAQMAKLLLSR
jgi:HAD superfamily hydrolase (TIGR01484 family)